MDMCSYFSPHPCTCPLTAFFLHRHILACSAFSFTPHESPCQDVTAKGATRSPAEALNVLPVTKLTARLKSLICFITISLSKLNAVSSNSQSEPPAAIIWWGWSKPVIWFWIKACSPRWWLTWLTQLRDCDSLIFHSISMVSLFLFSREKFLFKILLFSVLVLSF